MKITQNYNKGNHNFLRIFYISINLLVLIDMFLMMISGIMISASVFSFLNIPTTIFARNLHMISTSWGFILIAIHIGLHLTILINKLNKKLKDNTFEYVNYFLQGLVVAFGIYSFISQKIYSDMFLLSHFKQYNYGQNIVSFYIELISILLGIVIIINYFLQLIKKKNIKKEKNK